MRRIDITENIASGNIAHIVSILSKFLEMGYDTLYWDGYDSSIHIYKYCETEEAKKINIDKIKNNYLTACQELPEELKKALEDRWKRMILDLLN